MITIIDYGMGNVGSIQNMINKVGGEAKITSDLEEISQAKKLILPRVGAFDNGMAKLKEKGLIELLNQKVLVEKIPILGICLGMQLMTKSSEEGTLSGLAWLDAETVKFSFGDKKLRIPHMGWNEIQIKKSDTLFNSFDNSFDEVDFYFVHSYYVKCENIEDVAATCNYGIEFCCSFQRENIYATQFHPEKSHKFGMKLLKNFVELI